MRTEIKLHTTPDDFTSLHAAVDKTRSTSKNVTVDKAKLMRLLLDHSKLLAAMPAADIEYPVDEAA